jgi:hypothetical protein
MIDPNTLLSNVGSSRGAPMGRLNVENNPQATVTLFRMRMVDGDYDAGGAYWGSGTPLYAAIGEGFEYFIRSNSLSEAKMQILENYPDLTIQTTEVNDDFVNGYITAALWSSNDDEDVPLDSNYCRDDIDPETLQKMIEDCGEFIAANSHLLLDENCHYVGCSMMEYAGHDFWLTRNGHGCGFWDGDWENTAGEKLTEASKKFREFDLCVGDDGKICH